MPNVSGALYYDGNRTATVGTATGVIANVPIILQDSVGNILQTVLTDSTGHFMFTGVVAGNYMVSEAYDGVSGKCPPLSYVVLNSAADSIPPSATHLDCTVRNTWLETVNGGDITNINMMNGPVCYEPLVLDPNMVLHSTNLVTAADNGTFGLFNPGTVANTGAGTGAGHHPYPEIVSAFGYVEPNPNAVTPPDGSYTIQNIMNNAWSNSHPSTIAPAWWRIADHTTGNETGRMMVINGYTQGYVIGQATIVVDANTKYLTSYWILNLCRQATGYINPEFSVLITDQDDNVIYEHDFTDEIIPNPQCPKWQQIGTIFTTADDTTAITIQFISQGGAATGNDFVLDDVALNEVDVLELDITKEVSCSYATIGGVLYYGITITNPTDYLATQIILTDDLSENFDDVEFTLDGENWLPWTGSLDIDDLAPGESGDIIIRGKVKIGADIVNTATVQANFCTVVVEEEEV